MEYEEEDDLLDSRIANSDKVERKRLSVPDKKKMRNLVQYRNMSDDKFDQIFEQKVFGVVPIKEFEERIQRKINEFGKDYDLDDLNSNDRLTLRALAQAYVDLEDYTILEYNLRKEGIKEDMIMLIDKIGKVKNDLRNGISNMSNDLKITRKVRKADKEQSVLAYLEDLKKKAKEFYESKMQLVFCPKCQTWVASVWTLYPENTHNKLTVVCNRELEDGQKCGEKITVLTSELLKTNGTNKQDIPDSIK